MLDCLDFLKFLHESPTPFHATRSLSQRLEAAGFQCLDETAAWGSQPPERFYIIRHDASLIAGQLKPETALAHGLRMVAAHTDSPCLKLKPQPDLLSPEFWQLGVEVYGGALLAPWFDRDLSIAGRVSYQSEGQLHNALVDFQRPLLSIPNLAIHLNREANKGWPINAQTEMAPLMALADAPHRGDFAALLTQRLAETGHTAEAVLDFDLCLYDTQPPARTGLNEEFISSARLDNLLSCYAGLQALLHTTGDEPRLLICSDHEEVGSVSAAGADGPFLRQVLLRLLGDEAHYVRTLQRSLLVSTDNAHALHPNYRNKHDEQHRPLINAGPVLKFNANQRYATSSETAACFRMICAERDIPLQSFVSRCDMPCGSTVGPLTAAQTGVRTLDVGAPTYAMHSIREMAGCADVDYLIQALTALYETPHLPWA